MKNRFFWLAVVVFDKHLMCKTNLYEEEILIFQRVKLLVLEIIWELLSVTPVIL